MHPSRSESSLHGSRPNSQSGARLTPVSNRRSGSRAGQLQEEKQSPLAHSPSASKFVRIVDSTGRPIDTPSPKSNTRSKVDSDGLPLLSILSPQGLKASDGDMSAILLSKVKKQSASNLAALSAAKGSPLHNQAKMQKKAQAYAAELKAAELTRSGVARTAAYQPTGITGRPTLVSDARAAEVEAPRPSNSDWKQAGPKVVDFTADGGMGGRVGNQSFDGMEDFLTGGFGESGRRDGPQHLHALSSGVGEKSAMLRSQLRGLDLLSTAFGQLIEEVAGSKGNLARLLTRVRDNYRLLFSNLIENILDINSAYHNSLKGCIQDYKSLQLRMDGKVAHLEHRVRLLTSISTSKDNMIELGEDNLKVLESEMKELKESVILGIKSATLKVETASNTIIQDSALAQAQAAAAALSAQSGALSPGGDTDSINDGSAEQGATFATASSVDALTTLSHESRNLTLEISELIQNVEAQQERSAAALGGLDSLLQEGVPFMEDLSHDASQRRKLASAKGASVPEKPQIFIPPGTPVFRQRSAGGSGGIITEHVPMQVEHSPAMSATTTPGATPTPRALHSAGGSRGNLSPAPSPKHGAHVREFSEPSDLDQPQAGSFQPASPDRPSGRTSRQPSLAAVPTSPTGGSMNAAKERSLQQEAIKKKEMREQLAAVAAAAEENS